MSFRACREIYSYQALKILFVVDFSTSVEMTGLFNNYPYNLFSSSTSNLAAPPPSR